MVKLTPKQFMSKVAIARQLLREKSEEILKQYLQVVDEARAAGDYETAAKSLQWLIDHMPASDGEERIVSRSVDKQADVKPTGPVGPPIQIGIQVGGLGSKSLPEPPKPEITVESVNE